ncbi:MAG: thymidine kinase [Bacillota bacterium]|nr:thymidine kinase [Bacillota bacterium]
MSKLYFRYGAMNCGKSTNLLQAAYNYEERGMNVLILKPQIDTKGNDKIISRLDVKRKVDHLIHPSTNIFCLINSVLETEKVKKPIDCILIDEAQFLKSEQVDQLMQIVVKLNIPVICYGLRTDFKTNGFEGSTRLLQLAHTIEELKTICRCGKKALFNARKVNGEFTLKGEQVAIDMENNIEYESLCADCYYKILK